MVFVVSLLADTFGISRDSKTDYPVPRAGYQRLKQNITMSKADHHEGLDFYADAPYPPRQRVDESGQLKPLG